MRMGESMKENGRQGNNMVKEHILGLMVTSMKETGKMENNMVKGYFISMMAVRR